MNIIPECIRNVLRPKDTQIVDTKTSSHKHFAVRIKYTPEERAEHNGTKYGPIIGHIYEGATIFFCLIIF